MQTTDALFAQVHHTPHHQLLLVAMGKNPSVSVHKINERINAEVAARILVLRQILSLLDNPIQLH